MRYLEADLSISCDGKLYSIMKAWAIFSLFAIPIGIPLCFFSVLWVNRQAISSRDASQPCPPELNHIAIIFRDYTNESMYWEVVESVRRLLLSSVVVFMGRTSPARCVWGTILSLFFAVLCSEVQPCLNPVTQGFAFMTQWIVFANFLFAVILSVGIGLFSPSFVGVLFVILMLVVVVGAFGHRHKGKRSEHNERPNQDHQEAKKVTPQPCVIICDPGRASGWEFTFVLLRILRDLDHVDPKAVIANLWPQQERARLLRKRLDSLGLQSVPVGVGTSGGATTQDFEIAKRLRASLAEDRSADEVIAGSRLLEEVLLEADPGSLVLLITASLKARIKHLKHGDPPPLPRRATDGSL